MLKTTISNLRNQCAYKPTVQDILCAIAMASLFLLVAILEGGIM